MTNQANQFDKHDTIVNVAFAHLGGSAPSGLAIGQRRNTRMLSAMVGTNDGDKRNIKREGRAKGRKLLKKARLDMLKANLAFLFHRDGIVNHAELASRLGVSRAMLSSWVNGVNGISPGPLSALAKFFNVPGNTIDPGPDYDPGQNYDPDAVVISMHDPKGPKVRTPLRLRNGFAMEFEDDPEFSRIALDCVLPTDVALDIVKMVKKYRQDDEDDASSH